MLILTVIYLGNKLPKYVLRNLAYLQSTFLEDEIYFISDSEKSLSKASKTGVKTWRAPDPDKQWQLERESLSHPMGFRDGFWFKTLARIFVLNSFMQLHPDRPILQVEADVFLFPYFPISKFRDLEVDIAFPMESNQMGIASLLFLHSHKVSEILSNLIIKVIQDDGHLTDMSLLGKVAHSKILEFSPLPPLPISMQEALNEPDALQLVCNNTLGVEGVFDGISVGQYLLGIDSRNSRGVRILHRSQPSHAINPDKLVIGLDDKENLILEGETENLLIYNLHNHAKDLRLYKASSRKKLLKSRVASSRGGERHELEFKILALALYGAIARRVKHRFG